MSQQLDELCRIIGPKRAILLDSRSDAPTFVPFMRDPREREEARGKLLGVYPALAADWRRGA